MKSETVNKFTSFQEAELFLEQDRKNLTDSHVPISEIKVGFVDESRNDRYYNPERPPADVTEIFRNLCLNVDGSKHGGQPGPLHFCKHSWGQFSNLIKLPVKFSNKLLSDNNPQLFLQNVQHCLSTSALSILLLRCREQKEGTMLRGVLTPHYNRLDRQPVLEALAHAFDLSGSFSEEQISIELGSDRMAIDLYAPTTHKLLKRVGDTCLSGLRLECSEVGHRTGLLVDLKFLRLQCTNGMTSDSAKKFKIPQTLTSLMTTNYPNQLPPFPYPSDLRKDLLHCFDLIFEDWSINVIKQLGQMQEQLEVLLDQQLDLSSRKAVLATIAEVLKLSGLRVLAGISSEAIYECYMQELEQFPGTRSSAYLLYNAITRYASHHLHPESETRNLRERSRRRRRTSEEDWELSLDVTRKASRITSKNFAWDKVVLAAQRELLRGPEL